MNFINYINRLNKFNYKKFDFKKYFHISSIKNNVRVRFAPSPTGYLHLGGLRTALYNFLYARANNGTFILRIEDTDQTRLIENGIKHLIEDLEWAGIIPDEGPNFGGNFGPYIQSERVHLYKKHADKLVANGYAYKCFCSEKRIDLLRKEALRTRQIPGYDNKCRHLSQEKINENIENKIPFCIRFKLSPYLEPIQDLNYEPIIYNIAESEGDPVILKTDGFPTYHLANIVDDHLMKITHVLRGVEWQISTIKHILLYRASGWQPPHYCHLPLIMNSDGTKLSKRQGDIRISEYRKNGIFPFSLLQYITQTGGGFKINTESCSSIKELTQNFDLNSLLKSSCRLSPPKLLEFNKQEIERRLQNDKLTQDLIDRLKLIIIKKFESKKDFNEINLDSEYIKEVLYWSRDRINTLSDLVEDKLEFIWVFPKTLNFNTLNFEKSLLNEHFGQLYDIMYKLEESKFNKEYFREFLKQYCKKNKLKFQDIMKMMRYSLTGLQEGPSVGEILQILGKKCTLSRLENAKKFII